jgi:hypothetical protein
MKATEQKMIEKMLRSTKYAGTANQRLFRPEISPEFCSALQPPQPSVWAPRLELKNLGFTQPFFFSILIDFTSSLHHIPQAPRPTRDRAQKEKQIQIKFNKIQFPLPTAASMMNRVRTTVASTSSHVHIPSSISSSAASSSSSSPVSWQRTMDDMIHRYANLKQTPVSVKNMIVFGKDANMNTLLRSHAFLRYELPIRLAHIAKEITALPEELLEVEPVQKVLNWYRLSFSGTLPLLTFIIIIIIYYYIFLLFLYLFVLYLFMFIYLFWQR